ncbi:MAG: S1 RNA-binding domain-containing protein [Lachnospiraceae bacterium]|nr:S1 RNA-binding domain-containing protein [Lachnospiraceae bacterium]
MLELGKRQTLNMIRRTEHGVYLGSADSEESVLLPKKYVPEGLAKGDEISVFLYKDSSDRLIATTLEPLISLSETAVLTVKQVGKIGAFLDSGLDKDFLLPFAEQTCRVKEGDKCLTALYIDKSERLCLTMKVYDYLSKDSPYKKDDEVTGRIYEKTDSFGAFVAVDDKYSALIPKKELFTDLPVNSVIKARVTDVKEDGKLDLSIRKKSWLQMDDDAIKIMELLDSYGGRLPFNDKASPELIQRETDMSKKEFKRAVGKLYKERRIIIGEDFIERTGL